MTLRSLLIAIEHERPTSYWLLPNPSPGFCASSNSDRILPAHFNGVLELFWVVLVRLIVGPLWWVAVTPATDPNNISQSVEYRIGQGHLYFGISRPAPVLLLKRVVI